MGVRKWVCYIGRLQEVWPIRTMEQEEGKDLSWGWYELWRGGTSWTAWMVVNSDVLCAVIHSTTVHKMSIHQLFTNPYPTYFSLKRPSWKNITTLEHYWRFWHSWTTFIHIFRHFVIIQSQYTINVGLNSVLKSKSCWFCSNPVPKIVQFSVIL
jgi:hypothetical protein